MRSRPSLPGFLAILAASAAALATSYPLDQRTPCDGATDFDPNAPLALSWGISGAGVPVDTPTFRDGVTILDADGQAVEYDAIEGEWGQVLICPIGGLAPDSDYTWVVDRFEEDASVNQAGVPYFQPFGSWSFHTAAESALPALDGCPDPADYAGYTTDCWAADTADTGGGR